MANANLTYCLLSVDLSGGEGSYPAFVTKYGTTYASEQGSATLTFDEVTDPKASYAIIVYARLGGLTGVGYAERVSSSENEYVLPLVDSMGEGRILSCA